jgi:putative membrane protein
MTKKRLTLVSGLILAVFAAVSLSFIMDEEVVPAKGALITLLPLVFALVHGAVNYRFRDVLVFVGVTFVVSNAFENLSILTGFPFGDYYYTDILGPKLFEVPLLIGPAYIATGYLAWTLARTILGATKQWLPGSLTFTVPLLASFIMVSWDFAMDPITATIGQQWIWEDGGGYFGVPFSNFMGWYLTVWVFFQLFALYLRRREDVYADAKPEPRGYWIQAALCYGVVAMKFPLNILVETTNETIADPVGVLWRTGDIYLTCGLVSIFTMFVFTALSLMRIAALPAVAREPRTASLPAGAAEA